MMGAMRVKARLSVCSHLLAGCLLFACGSSSGGPPPPPAPDPTAPLVNAEGTWSVQAVFISATGSCAAVVGQVVTGLLFFTQNGTALTVEDEDGALTTGTVAGNTVTFSYTLLGITEDWSLVVYGQNTFLAGTISVTGPGCTAVANVTGTRIGPVAVSTPPQASGDRASGAQTMTVLRPGESAHVTLPGGLVEVVAVDEPTTVVSIEPGGAAGDDLLAPESRSQGLFGAIVSHHEPR